MQQSGRQILRIDVLNSSKTAGTLVLGNLRKRCALGRTGSRAVKREGDGATPFGRFRLIEVRYRRDQRPRPLTGLPVIATRRRDGWCDAVGDRNYNRAVQHPYPASAEAMWRDDDLYDLVVVLSHNRVPRQQRLGSAVFMHVARPDFSPTAGCIALSANDLALVLSRIQAGAVIAIGPVHDRKMRRPRPVGRGRIVKR